MRRLAFLLAVALTVCGAAFADVWYVDDSNTGGPWDGLSWATAFQLIQDGVDAASSGDEVWVVGATYEESVTLVSGVSVYGGFYLLSIVLACWTSFLICITSSSALSKRFSSRNLLINSTLIAWLDISSL